MAELRSSRPHLPIPTLSHPESVRAKTPYFPERARRSREHYPGLEKGRKTIWHADGREVWLDDNQHAQMAWERYTGHGLVRGTGYSVRHIWGYPWNPDLFTAGWNICYMPFWAGMLTERQNPHPELEQAIRQASWELYFRNNPVCQPPDFIADPGLDLSSLLVGQPLLILEKTASQAAKRTETAVFNSSDLSRGRAERVRGIRSQTHQREQHSQGGAGSPRIGTRAVRNAKCREQRQILRQENPLRDRTRLCTD